MSTYLWLAGGLLFALAALCWTIWRLGAQDQRLDNANDEAKAQDERAKVDDAVERASADERMRALRGWLLPGGKADPPEH